MGIPRRTVEILEKPTKFQKETDAILWKVMKNKTGATVWLNPPGTMPAERKRQMDGRDRRGEFSCCFWASAGKLAGKQNGFPEKNREKPDGTTGNPTDRSQRVHGGSMGKSARGIVRKNKRPPPTARPWEQGPNPQRQTGEQEGISGNMNQFLFSARQW